MLNLIAGVYTADAGSIVLDGADITKLQEYKRAKLLGRVFQDPMMGTAGNMGIEEKPCHGLPPRQDPHAALGHQ